MEKVKGLDLVPKTYTKPFFILNVCFSDQENNPLDCVSLHPYRTKVIENSFPVDVDPIQNSFIHLEHVIFFMDESLCLCFQR